MRARDPVNFWSVRPGLFQRGGKVLVRPEQAPLGRVLPYRRAAGEGPRQPTPLLDQLTGRGWMVDLGGGGLGDLVLGLSGVRAAMEACEVAGQPRCVTYRGPRARLMERCLLPWAVEHDNEGHRAQAEGRQRVTLPMAPGQPSAWLDKIGADELEVHAALPMRYYLEMEQATGVRLPAVTAPAPGFSSRTATASAHHVVFVITTSWSDRKDYSLAGFARIAKALANRVSARWHFTVVTPVDPPHEGHPFADLPHELLQGLDARDCLDVFGAAALVIGNDTGLTHLAALCTRSDGTGPQVVGLYGRHAYSKWTTGADRHHAVATPFSQMMAVADACPVRDGIDDAAWGDASRLTALPAEAIASFAGECAGWW